MITLGLTVLLASADGQQVDIDQLTESFQKTLAGIVAETTAPGGVAAFVLPDGTRRTVAVGLADKEAGTLMKPDSRMLSGSVGKSFVATTALSLAMDGTIDLDAPISTWLGNKPWFARLPNGSNITLRHLLQHRAGLVDHVFMPEFAKAVASGDINLASDIPIERFIEFALDQEPLFPVGEGFSYTDTGYLVAGLVIEAATGNTYYGELRRRVLDPLGLMLTSPSDHPRLPGLVPGYMPVKNLLGLPTKTLTDNGVLKFFNPSMEWTGGGLVTNPGDLAYYARELYEGRVISGEYLEQLLEPKRTSPNRSESAYGLGQGMKPTEFGMVYGHSGWIPGYTSFMAYYPDYGIAIAAQFNVSPEIHEERTPVDIAKERLPSVVINVLKQIKK